MKTTAKLWIGIGILALLSPLGLILPERFKAGDAWGEWGIDAFKEIFGYVPVGLRKLSNLWSAPFSDYAFNSQQDKGLCQLSLGYIASAVIGILVIVCVAMLLGGFLSKGKPGEKR